MYHFRNGPHPAISSSPPRDHVTGNTVKIPVNDRDIITDGAFENVTLGLILTRITYMPIRHHFGLCSSTNIHLQKYIV